MNKKHLRLLGIVVSLAAVCLSACSTSNDQTNQAPSAAPKPKKEIAEFSVSSNSLRTDGKWLSIITKSKGENLSPQLSWEPVAGAQNYAIYMVDTSAGNWLHWVAKEVEKTNLAIGENLANSKYVGPYPPSGDHTYLIMVFALKAIPDAYPGNFDDTNAGLQSFHKVLDVSQGKTGNIIATGSLSGTYASGAIVK